ncbi:MAG: hypothetical protein JSR98_17435 [Proteobacteria bacterium]|nr:hypothetical protein [Pseudomonadota bacterium]
MRPLQRRWLQAASGAAGLIVGLAACQAAPSTSDELIARQKALDPPQLWLAQVLGDGGKVKGAVFVCADGAMREGFARARAEINGHPCVDATSPRVKPNGWRLRCTLHGRSFTESSVTVGDLQQDFLVNFSLTEQTYFGAIDPPPPQSVRQIRRYRHIGACPMGWRIGDQARPGRRPHTAI